MTGPWLVSLQLNLNHPAARRDLADAGAVHRRVMSLVPDDLGDHARSTAAVLYRIEHTRAGIRILTQTGIEPTLANLPDGYAHVPEPRSLHNLLAALQTGTQIAYRITANTSKRLPREYVGSEGKPGQVIALRSPVAIQAWWQQRAASNGLQITSAATTTHDDIRARRLPGTPHAQHSASQFDGQATVTDPEAVAQAIRKGIGRGKSFGCGLLSVALIQ